MNRKITIISSMFLLLTATACLQEEMPGRQPESQVEQTPLALKSVNSSVEAVEA